MKLRRYFSRNRQAAAARSDFGDYVVEPMEPRLLLSADALGIDAGVLNLEGNEHSAWELTTSADWSRTAATLTAGANALQLTDVENIDDSTDDGDTVLLSSSVDSDPQRTEIAFLDAGVADGPTLLDSSISENGSSITQVYLIDASQDGIEQITAILNQHANIDAVHIISHGSAGQIHLGNSTLSSGSLENYQQSLIEWGETLSESADILIYGCDIASDAAGQTLVDTISTLTGADVAASDDLTGNASSGGDWDLEYRVGMLETDAFDESNTQGWQGTLGEISSDGAGSANATAMDANGNYVVVYSALNQDGDGWGVYAQRYDSAGVAQGGEILVNQTTTDDQRWASVGMSDAGEFVVTWTSSNQDGTASSIYARQFNDDGTVAGGEFRVNTENTGAQTNASIDVDAAGNFIIVWQGNGPADSDGVFFRRFNADGSDIDTNEVIAHTATDGTTAEFDSVVAWQSNGKFVIAWEQDNDNIYFQRFDNAGSMLGSKTQIDIGIATSSGLSIDANASGTFVVAYKEENISSAIYVKAFNEDGSIAFTNGDWVSSWAQLGDNNSLNPSVAIDDSGEILVAYQTEATGGDIHLQRINADGSEPGPAETIVTDAGDQGMPAIAIQDVDNYAIAWNDVGSSGVNTQTENATNNEQILSVNTGTTVDEGSAGQVITTAMLETTDVDNTPDQLVYTLTAVPANGTLYLNATALGLSDTFTQDDIDNGRISYDHDDSETTSDNFDFSVDDGTGIASTGTFIITVNPVNDNSPTADAESFTVVEGGTANAANLDNGNSLLDGDTDTDLPNDTLIVNTTPVVDVSHGTLTLNSDGTFSYTHNGSENFADSFTYEISDGAGHTDTATVIITITPVNDAPVATANTINTTEDTPYSFNISDFTYADAESDALLSATLSNLSLTGGTLEHSGGTTVTDGMTLTAAQLNTLIYTPAADATGSPLATFDFTVNDADLGVVSAQMSIDVSAVNDAPVTNNVSASGNEDAPSIAITLTGSDLDGTVDFYQLNSLPANGQLYTDAGLTTLAATGMDYAATAESLTLYFVPNANTNGNTTFDFVAKDNAGALDATPATATITVNPLNDTPVAVDDAAVVDEGNSVIINLVGNDSDADNALDLSSIVITGAPANGNLVDNGDGTLTYTHNGSETTADSFSYTIADVSGAPSNVANVSLSVNPVNDNDPIADDESFTVAEGGTATAADLDAGTSLLDGDTDLDLPNDSLSVNTTPVAGPTHGLLTLNADGSFTYTHDGSENFSDSFTYELLDADGGVTDTATVTISLTPVNEIPVVMNLIPDQVATEDIAFNFQFAADTFNDVDTGDSLTYTAQLVGGIPLPGWLSFDAATHSFSGTPANSDVGVIEIEVIATDTVGSTATLSFDLTVNNVNDAPLVSNNNLVLLPGDTVVMNAEILSAIDADHADPGLIFTVSNVIGGQFELVTAPGVAVTSFTQAQVTVGTVVFVDDGDESLPAYDVTVSDGIVSTDPQSATISFAAPPLTFSTAPTTPLPLEATTPSEPDPAVTTQTESAADETVEAATDGTAEQAAIAHPLQDNTSNGADNSAVVTFLAPDFDSSFIAASSPLQTLLNKLLIQHAVQTAATILPGPLDLELDALTSEIRTALVSDGFNDSLNLMRDDISSATSLHQNIVASSIAATTGLSVGYIAWLIRGGVLLSTALSSLPAWQFIDPLPVLAHNNNKEVDDEDDSLEEIIKEESQKADKQNSEPNHQMVWEETEITSDERI